MSSYMKVDIQAFLNQYNDFDIRLRGDARYVDHKCTPDIVCFIADCILNTCCAIKPFTIKDLWKTDYFIQNTRVAFHKPYADDESAKNEYNKVLCQPLKLLAYAHVLNVDETRRTLVFSVNDVNMLEYIASRENCSYNFLSAFFTRVVTDSGIMRFFIDYESECRTGKIRDAKDHLYSRYNRFIAANTPTKSKLDTDRMLHKVLNVFAFTKLIPGSNGKIPDWNDLMYNRPNWRDKYKSKILTRKEAAEQERDEINANFYIEYQVSKAIKNVKKQQGDISEIQDELANGKATEVHHIFPKSAYPTIATFYENLILLTSSQHRQKAHPNGNTQIVNRDYQLVCLMAKSRTIESSIAKGDNFYRRDYFVKVINIGLNEALDISMSFEAIREFLVNLYIKA